jgi:hypothetical protein
MSKEKKTKNVMQVFKSQFDEMFEKLESDFERLKKKDEAYRAGRKGGATSVKTEGVHNRK